MTPTLQNVMKPPDLTQILHPSHNLLNIRKKFTWSGSFCDLLHKA